MARDPNVVAQRWADRLGNATEKMREGAENLTVSPTKLAADSLEKAKAGYIKAIESGKTRKALLGVSIDDWKKSYIEKGLNRVSEGARAAIPKMEAFMKDFLPFQDAVVAEIKKMPNVTLQNSIDRAIAYMRKVAEYKK